MPIWLIAAIVLASVAIGAMGEHSRSADLTPSRTYGQHRPSDTKTTVAELITRIKNSPQTQPAWVPPAWDDTEEIPAIAVPADETPARGGDVAAWVLRELRNGHTA